jgi:hypothetical protein
MQCTCQGRARTGAAASVAAAASRTKRRCVVSRRDRCEGAPRGHASEPKCVVTRQCGLEHVPGLHRSSVGRTCAGCAMRCESCARRSPHPRALSMARSTCHSATCSCSVRACSAAPAWRGRDAGISRRDPGGAGDDLIAGGRSPRRNRSRRGWKRRRRSAPRWRSCRCAPRWPCRCGRASRCRWCRRCRRR